MLDYDFDVATGGLYGWSVNGEEVDGLTQEYLDRKSSFNSDNWTSSTCPHCHQELTSQNFEDVMDGNDVWHNDQMYASVFCENCSHWEFSGMEGGNKCMDIQRAVLISSVYKKFSTDLPDGCSEELAQYLRRHPEYWNKLDPKAMEKFVADIFKANHRASEVFHVGKPFDGGVDVIYIDSNGTKWLIQVKRRENPNKSEGFETLQSLLGTLVLEGEQHGIIVSTSNSFSHYARKKQKQAKQNGYVIEMIDKGKLNRMVGLLLPSLPWHQVFSHPALSHISDDIKTHFSWRTYRDYPECGEQLRLF